MTVQNGVSFSRLPGRRILSGESFRRLRLAAGRRASVSSEAWRGRPRSSRRQTPVFLLALLAAAVLSQSLLRPAPTGRVQPEEVAVLIQRGQEALDQGRLEEAVRQFREALALEPSRLSIRLSLCQAYFMKGQPGSALEEAEAVLKSKALDADIAERLGLVCGRGGMLDCAVEAFRSGLEIAPASLSMRFNLALALYSRGDFRETVQTLRGAPEANWNGDYHALLGSALVRLDLPQEGIDVLRRAVQLNPASERARHELGMVLANQGDYAGAAMVLEDAAEHGASSSRMELALGMARFVAGLDEPSNQAFERAVELSDEPAMTLERIGDFYQMVGASERAQAFYGRAMELPAPRLEVYGKYADALHSKGRDQEAVAFIKSIIPRVENKLEREPDSVPTRLLLGRLHFSSGSLLAARGQFEAAAGLEQTAEASYHLGHLALEMGEVEEAERRFEETLARDGQFAPALIRLGRLLSDSGRWERGIELLERAVSLSPHNYEASLELARAQVTAGKGQETLPLLEKLVEKRPDQPQPHFLLSRVYREAGLLEDAARHHRLFQAYQAHADTILRARRRMEKGEVAEAMQLLLQALERGNESLEIVTALAAVSAMMEEWEAAAAYYRQSLEREPRSPELLSGLALALFRQGKASEAIESASESIELDPKQPSTWFLLGQARFESGAYEEAVSNFREAILRDPENEGFYLDFGKILVDGQSYDQAEKLYRYGLQHLPESARLSYALGVTCQLQLKWAEAQEFFRKVLELDSDFPKIRLSLARSLVESGDFDRAEEVFREALDLGEGDYETRYFYGILLNKQNRAGEAVKQFRLCVELDDENALAHYYLGKSLFDDRQPEAAERELKRALELRPSLKEAYYELGRLYRQSGRLEEARHALEIYSELRKKESAEKPDRKVLIP